MAVGLPGEARVECSAVQAHRTKLSSASGAVQVESALLPSSGQKLRKRMGQPWSPDDSLELRERVVTDEYSSPPFSPADAAAYMCSLQRRCEKRVNFVCLGF
eukprot:67407-Pelagomonas_calceolata.AAC.1